MKISKTFIGIDPGVNGYIAKIISPTEVEIDPIGDIFEWPWFEMNLLSDEVIIVAEKVQPRPNQGLKGVVTSCVNYGRLDASMFWHELSPFWVTPQKWQRAMGLSRRWQRPKGLTDEQYSSWKYSERKKWHKREAKALFPALKITLLNADALLIAEYARRFYNK